MTETEELRVVPAEQILQQLDGAQIACSYVEDEEGLHVEFHDGRCLVISGYFAIAIIQSTKGLH
jgi:hypothetical protein